MTQGSQSLALGLTLIAAPQLGFVITSNVDLIREYPPPLRGPIILGALTQGSPSLALGLTLIAAPQLCFVITSNVDLIREYLGSKGR